jgi:hypothetical protein
MTPHVPGFIEGRTEERFEIIGDFSVLLSLSKYELVEAFLGFSAES